MTVNRRKELLKIIPEALPVTRQWLMEQDEEFSRHAMDNYVKSGDLVSVAHGVYTRPDTTLTWESVVCFLQNILKTDLTVGGLTILEMKGLSHYVGLSERKVIHLYGKDPLPEWINNVVHQVQFERHTQKISVDDIDDLGASGLVNDEYDTGLKKLYSGDHMNNLPATEHKNLWPLTRSSTERACLEMMADVPEEISFEHANQLMQGLTNLSPRRLERLLRKTKNIKIRRLFYWFAERNNYTWFKKLPSPYQLDELGLGKGKRMLVKGGKLDSKYMITVPADMASLDVSY